MENGRLARYSVPTKWETAEYGAIWQAILEHGHELYIQTSKDEDSPNWVKIGQFLEKVFENKLHEEKFIEECLGIYNK